MKHKHPFLQLITKWTFLGMLLLQTSVLYAQVEIEITPFGGWLWTGKAPVYVWEDGRYRQIDVKVTDKVNYGARVGVRVDFSKVIEFEYNRTEAAVVVPGAETDTTGSFGFSANYYMLGGVYERPMGNATPFGTLNFGLVNFRGQEGERKSVNMMAAGLGGGIKYDLTESIGIRVQARLLLPMQFSGVGLGCGIGSGGGGCGVSTGGYTSVLQGDITGGLVLHIGN